jgi:hypothetical protein
MEAYFNENTPELREWLKSQGLIPETYPDCERQGLTAPYPNCNGEMVMYSDGLRYDTDDDANEFTICDTEEEFKRLVIDIKNGRI